MQNLSNQKNPEEKNDIKKEEPFKEEKGEDNENDNDDGKNNDKGTYIPSAHKNKLTISIKPKSSLIKQIRNG